MEDRPGTNTVLVWHERLVQGLTALEDRLVQLSWMKSIELPVLGITVPTLVVLAAWLGIVLGLPLALTLGLAMTLGLALVFPFMLRGMRFFTPIEADDTRCIAPTNLAVDASSFFVDPDFEGWYGPMANTLSDLTAGQLELIGDLLDEYRDKADLTQGEWAEVQSAMDIIEIRLEEL